LQFLFFFLKKKLCLKTTACRIANDCTRRNHHRHFVAFHCPIIARQNPIEHHTICSVIIHSAAPFSETACVANNSVMVSTQRLIGDGRDRRERQEPGNRSRHGLLVGATVVRST
jgi:hypothetical protein